MCGRMALTLPQDAMAQIFAARPANDLPEIPNFNICPTDSVHVVTSVDRVRHLTAMRWGFIPKWYKTPSDGPLLINARAETVAEKPSFRDAVRFRRAIIVASGYYEWTKDAEGGRDPWYITRQNGAPLAFAALWQDWTDQAKDATRTCAVITTASTGAMTGLHHRVPVVLNAADWPLWLGERGKGAAPLMQAPVDDVLSWHRVDRTVNSNRASGPELIRPLA